MPAPIIAAGIGGVSSLLGGALAGRSKTYTSTTTPQWSPEMQGLMSRLSAFTDQSMSNPGAGLQPIKQAATDNINRNYQGLSRRLSSQFASRGYGSSGDFGNSLYETEYQRAGDLSQLEGQFADREINQRNLGASLSEQLLGMTRGTTTTGNSPSTAAGDAFQSAGNGLSNLSTLLMLSNVLKQPIPTGGNTTTINNTSGFFGGNR
jgi:hypothetical protein